MKRELFRRIVSLVLAITVMISSTNTVLAVDKVSEYEYKSVNQKSEANPMVRNWVSPNTSIDLYPTLESYVGLSQKFYVTTRSDSTSGALFLYLYSPSGKLVSKDWIIGDNESTYWTVTLPSSGTWKLHVVAQGTNADVLVGARWQPK